MSVAPAQKGYSVLEEAAAASLTLAPLTLAWVTAAAYWPEWAEWLPTEAAVVLVVGSLTLTLVLVAALALVQLHGEGAAAR